MEAQRPFGGEAGGVGDRGFEFPLIFGVPAMLEKSAVLAGEDSLTLTECEVVVSQKAPDIGCAGWGACMTGVGGDCNASCNSALALKS